MRKLSFLLLVMLSVQTQSSLLHAQFSGSIDNIYMSRRGTADESLTTLFMGEWNANQLDFDEEPAIQFAFAYDLDCRHSIEFRYMNIDSLQASKQRFGGGVAIRTPSAASYFAGVADLVRFEYGADLRSGEINLWRDYCWLRVHGGFRWAEVDETFVNFNNGTAIYSLATTNRLYGFQGGGEVLLFTALDGAVEFDLSGKAGIYHNSASGRAHMTGAAGPQGSVSATSDRAAFLGEAAITGSYCIKPNLKLRGGYQVLWLDGIATAPHMLSTANVGTGMATLNSTYSAVYSGAFFGLEGEF